MIQDQVSLYVLMESFVLGRPITTCTECVGTASEYSLSVYLDLLLSTALIKTWTTSFLTSEKNIPFLEGLNPQEDPQKVLSALHTSSP